MKLWDHQIRAIEKARGKEGFALFLEMGTGKTATAIHILKERYQESKRILRTLILCPPIVVQNWKKEFQVFSDLKASDVIPIVGTGTQRRKLVDKHLQEDKVFITNYETLLMPDIFKIILEKWHVEVLVCDESHKLKNPVAKKSKQARLLGDDAKHVYLLTGTPILNTPMDLYAQYRVMDGGKTFGTNFYSFRATYFYDKNAGMPSQRYFPQWILKPNITADLRKKLENTSITVTKEECLDLPDLVRQTISVELGKDQKKYYEQMKKDFIAFVEDKACVANLAITKALRLQQIISGHLTVENNGDIQVVAVKDNPRLKALKELLEDITEHSKVVIWAVFKEDFKQISKVCEELKLKYVEIHGEITQKRKDASVDEFKNDPDTRVLIGHPISGGIGISLVVAPYAIFYSRNFSLENDLQAESRNHRGGSEIHSKITRIDIVAPGTIDELILEKLKSKEAMGESIIRGFVKELK